MTKPIRCRLFGHKWDKRPYRPDKPPNDEGLLVCDRCGIIGEEWSENDD